MPAMTFAKALLDTGLVTDKDNKIATIKALTPEDKLWLKNRMKTELDIDIVNSDGSPA